MLCLVPGARVCALFKFWTWFFYFTLLFEEFSNIVLQLEDGKKWRNLSVSSSHVWMWELDYKESWALKNWCFWTVVLEKTLESPLNCKEIQPVHPKGNQPWVFIGRTDAEAETLLLWPPHAKKWLVIMVWSFWQASWRCPGTHPESLH